MDPGAGCYTDATSTRSLNDSDCYTRPTIPISGPYRSLVVSISMVDRTSDRLRVWDVQMNRRGTTNGCNAADELVCSGRPRIQGMVPCRISSSSVSPLANEVYQGPGIGISSRHATADCPMTSRVRLYSPAPGSRGGDGDPLSTFRTRTRGKLLCCRVPPMPPGYKPIIPVETSPIGAHRTVVAALEGLPADMPRGAKSARAAPRGARTGRDGRALAPARHLARGPPGTGRPVRKTREVGPGLGGSPGGRAAEVDWASN
jgi:hypothetical protein